ncbi:MULTISPECIES: transposase [unclassified Anabaena]|uniref:transposase n=1 Tax=unclassified Anabaena TaxID=2619674 RepID=UPI001447F020|nr:MULTISPECIES: transposase [unclassified Anabaena]MTJ08983.1 transposase [Anabaena sp. UHCC 0204]MTJ51819.1 transposase [Anabaena sp. UHCC 0253]
MTFDPEKHHRRSIRLTDYNYAQAGAYFVTICTYQKQCWFGDVKQGEIQLNQIGQIVVQEWLKSSEIRQEIELDEWVLMPNHLHGIVWIKDQDQGKGDAYSERSYCIQGFNQEGLQSRSLGSFINGFKCSVTRRVNLIRYDSDVSFWQRNYYESVIRSEEHLSNIKQYILSNPQNWEDDEEHPHNNSEWQKKLIDVRF